MPTDDEWYPEMPIIEEEDTWSKQQEEILTYTDDQMIDFIKILETYYLQFLEHIDYFKKTKDIAFLIHTLSLPFTPLKDKNIIIIAISQLLFPFKTAIKESIEHLFLFLSNNLINSNNFRMNALLRNITTDQKNKMINVIMSILNTQINVSALETQIHSRLKKSINNNAKISYKPF